MFLKRHHHSLPKGGCYYVNTVGLYEAKIRRYIKDQLLNESVKNDYDSDPDKDPFKGASKKKKILTNRLPSI